MREGIAARARTGDDTMEPSEGGRLDLNDALRPAAARLGGWLGPSIEVRLRLDMEIGPVHIRREELETLLDQVAALSRAELGPNGGCLFIATADASRLAGAETRVYSLSKRQFVSVTLSPTRARDRATTLETARSVPRTMSDAELRGRLEWGDALQAVEEVGGRLRVHVDEVGDTSFEIYLPAARPDGRGNGAVVTEKATATAVRVVVVDDDRAVRRAVRRRLEEAGYTPEIFESAVAALAHIGRGDHSVDLLITDVDMPEASGLELAESLGVWHPSGRVLFLSGHPASLVIPAEGLPNLRYGFLEKPFHGDALVEAVAGLLES